MRERLMPAIIVSCAILGSALFIGLSQSNAEVTKSIESLGRKIDSTNSTIDSLRPRTSDHNYGIEGEAQSIRIEYANGEIVEMNAGKDDYLEYKTFYMIVFEHSIVIHLVKPGEGLNFAAERKLIPFSAIRAVKQIRPE